MIYVPMNRVADWLAAAAPVMASTTIQMDQTCSVNKCTADLTALSLTVKENNPN